MWRVLLCCCFVVISSRAAFCEDWDPKTTWVFAVGVIHFDDPTIPSWPDKGRVDAKMIVAFAQRGVPANHIIFLKDAEATKAHIMERFNATLSQTGAADTLIFYYAGHGSRDYTNPSRPVSFIPYDSASSWSIKEVLNAIDQKFHGRRVLLTADCCYSGGLAEQAIRRPGSIAFAALTSAQPTSTSTGEWTFTQALTDMLQGNRLLDLNHDSHITLSEAATYINGDMAFNEGQLSSFVTTRSFPADLVMAQAQGDPLPQGAGTRCEGLYKGKWLKVTVVKTEGARSLVTWAGWDHSQDSWLSSNELRPYTPKTVPIGSLVHIQWGNKWYPGEVMKNELGLQLVHYDGYENIDDEWVATDRLKLR